MVRDPIVASTRLRDSCFSRNTTNPLSIKNHGELAVVLCFVFLYLAVAGGGRLCVDACVERMNKSRPLPESRTI